MRIIGTGLAVALLFAASVASAEEVVTARPDYLSTPQFDVQANGGVANYGRDLSTDVGAAYGVIVGFRPLTFMGIEGQYQGTTNGMSPARNRGFDHVTANGVLGDLRFGIPMRLEPFVFGGVGWQHFLQSGPAGIPDRTSNTAVFPVGGGVEARLGSNGIIGARFTYDIVNDKNILSNATNASLWTATANIGASIQ
jgi:hypothetical protein